MKSPSTSIGRSLLSQRVGGRGPEAMQISAQKPGGPSMVASGEGGIVASPGWNRGRLFERSAANYGLVMRKFGGAGVD
jgi:hypothetical protein